MTVEIRYDAQTARFGVLGVAPPLHADMSLKFGFDPLGGSPGVFVTRSPALVAPFYDLCTDEVKRIVYPYALNYHNSSTIGPIQHLWGGSGPVAAPQPYITGEASPYPFQWGGVQVLQSRRWCLLGDEAGSGKTLQSISVFNNAEHYPSRIRPGQSFVKPSYELRVLVGCPTFLVQNWIEEIEKWYRGYRIPIVALDKPKVNLPKAGFYVLPYSRADKHYELLHESGRFDGAILDEVHFLKGDLTVKRAGAFFGEPLKRPGLVAQCDRGFSLSGTPIPNQPVELFNILSTMGPEVLHGMHRAAFEFRYTDYDQFGRPAGAKREFALNAELRASGFMLRREKAAILPQLPAKQLALINMPLHGDIAALVREEAELFELAKMRPRQTAAELAELVGHIMRVRKAIAVKKAPMVAQYAIYQLATEERRKNRLVVFMLHTEAIDIIREQCEAARIRVFVVDGRVSTKRRHEMKTEFQKPGGPPTLFLGQIKAAGVGLTLTAARRVGMGEISWSFADNSQAMDRIHRIGQTEEVMVDILTFPHAVEAKVISASARKEMTSVRILDEALTSALLTAEDSLAPDLEDSIDDFD